MKKHHEPMSETAQEFYAETAKIAEDSKIDVQPDAAPDAPETPAEVKGENPNETDKCLEIIAALEKEKSELKDAYMRTAADMENLRKRTALEIEKTAQFAITKFAQDLLPVADNLSRALAALPKNAEIPEPIKNLISGIELTQKDLSSAFEKNGIHKQESKGKIFDPKKDKVVQEREDKTVPAGTVLEEWQPAYTIGDRILREAVVVVAKN